MSDGRFAQDSDAAPDDVTIPDPTDPAQQGLNPPAPIIDLGGDVEPGPSRPLGPRRLALLREQMAKHQQEIERSGTDDPTHVDPVLAQKQRRIAELASRAAISSEEDRQLADEAIAQTQSIRPITDEYLASLDEQDSAVTQQGASSLEEAPDEASEQTQPPEQDTEADPSDSAIEQTPWSQPVPVVPMPSEHEDDQPLADSVTEAAEGRSGDHPGEEPEGASVGDAAQDQSADNDEDPVEAQPAAEPVEEQPHDDGEQVPEPAGSDDSVGQIDSAEPIEEHASSLESAEAADAEETEETSTQASAAQPDAAAETEQAPSEPVRAVNAQGLQLMDPKDYRTPSDWRTPVLTIAAILVLVLLAILIIFVIP